MLRRPRFNFVVTALLLLGFIQASSVVVETQSAHAAESDESDLLQTARDQWPLDALAAPVLELVRPEVAGYASSAGMGGFAGLVMNAESHDLDLYWRGEVPKEILSLPDSVAGSELVIHSSKYSVAELQSEIDRLLKIEIPGIELTTLTPRSEGDGLGLGYRSDLDEQRAAEILRSVSNIPLVWTEKQSPVDASRWDNEGGFYGGAGIYSPGNIPCTSAWPVTSNATGNYYLVSAYHCFHGRTTNWPVWNDFAQIGIWKPTASRSDTSLDTTLIQLAPGIVSTPDVYSGGYNGEPTQPIQAIASNVDGKVVCPSGANSGLHCVTTDDVNITITSSTTGNPIHGVVTGEASNNGISHAQGDSGGAVIALYSGGWRAMGMVSSGNQQISCTGIPMKFGPPNKCFNRVYWVGAVTITNEMGMTAATY